MRAAKPLSGLAAISFNMKRSASRISTDRAIRLWNRLRLGSAKPVSANRVLIRSGRFDVVLTAFNYSLLWREAALEIFLDESDWDNVKVGYETQVVFDILPDSTFSGEVIRVDPALYAENNTSVVRAVVSLQKVDASFTLPLGSTASVEVIGGRAENAVLIPVEALHKAGDKYAVFVMENGQLRLRIVEVGVQNSVYAEITSGLEVGDIVSTGIIETK